MSVEGSYRYRDFQGGTGRDKAAKAGYLLAAEPCGVEARANGCSPITSTTAQITAKSLVLMNLNNFDLICVGT